MSTPFPSLDSGSRFGGSSSSLRALAVAIAYHPSERWSEHTVAAAMAYVADGADLTAQGWASMLDRIERSLARVVAELPPASSRPRLRAD
jgi:hypothetical protein